MFSDTNCMTLECRVELSSVTLNALSLEQTKGDQKVGQSGSEEIKVDPRSKVQGVEHMIAQ